MSEPDAGPREESAWESEEEFRERVRRIIEEDRDILDDLV